jgi:hypothetical protein
MVYVLRFGWRLRLALAIKGLARQIAFGNVTYTRDVMCNAWTNVRRIAAQKRRRG